MVTNQVICRLAGLLPFLGSCKAAMCKFQHLHHVTVNKLVRLMWLQDDGTMHMAHRIAGDESKYSEAR